MIILLNELTVTKFQTLCSVIIEEDLVACYFIKYNDSSFFEHSDKE
jgi:hypothetical protein